jgi:branched-chain amino acid aminotransferase
MAIRKVYFNGEFVSEQEARVSIFDSALMFGDMVFDMTRTYLQKPFNLGPIWSALMRGSSTWGLTAG